MKKTILGLGVMLMAVLAVASCGKSDDNKAGKPKNTTTNSDAVSQGYVPNVRFINLDTIGLKYNLAIDFNEQMIRLQNSLSEEEKRQQMSVQSKLAALQQKAEAATTQSELESISKQAQEAQLLAQQKMSDAGMNAEKTIAENSQILQDSLMNFLRDFAQQRGYDAIIVNTAAPYYNPALDVTEEVVEGLNARYNKVKK